MFDHNLCGTFCCIHSRASTGGPWTIFDEHLARHAIETYVFEMKYASRKLARWLLDMHDFKALYSRYLMYKDHIL